MNKNEGMSWDEYYLDMLPKTRSKSKDPSTQVGCIIAREDHSFASSGFNGFARGVRDKVSEVPERYERPLKYLFTAHAEKNAICAAAKHGTALEGGTLYLEWYPCADCMNMIIQAGIQEVVINSTSSFFNDPALTERWKEQTEVSKIMAAEAGVTIRCVPVKESD